MNNNDEYEKLNWFCDSSQSKMLPSQFGILMMVNQLNLFYGPIELVSSEFSFEIKSVIVDRAADWSVRTLNFWYINLSDVAQRYISCGWCVDHTGGEAPSNHIHTIIVIYSFVCMLCYIVVFKLPDWVYILLSTVMRQKHIMTLQYFFVSIVSYFWLVLFRVILFASEMCCILWEKLFSQLS